MNLVSEYLQKFKEEPDFQRLLELKRIIDQKYKGLIINLKNKEAKYLEAKEHPDYYPDFLKLQENFVQAKTSLYSKSEVQEYFQMERKLQDCLNEDFNELKEAISNKFNLNKIIKF